MHPNPVAENVLGTMGAICWTAQLVPQVWKTWREKSTKGLSLWLVLLWGLSAGFLGVYAIVQNLNVPLILQPQLFGLLSFISWSQCLYYEKKRSRNGSILSLAGALAAMASLQVGMVFAVRPSYNRGNIRPVQVFGIFSSTLISIALFPQYYEIYKHNEVIGISITFMAVDMLGGIFSDLSLAFKEEFDVIASITYTLVVVLDGIVLVAAMILNPRAKRRRMRLAAELVAMESVTGSAIGTRVITPMIGTPARTASPAELEGALWTQARIKLAPQLYVKIQTVFALLYVQFLSSTWRVYIH